MAHTFTNIVLHALFSTKDRARCITPELKPDLLAYMGGILRTLKVRTIVLNGVEDHVHFLAVLPPTLTTSHMMEVLKSNSTGWVRRKGEPHSSFGWQVGYTAFSVSQSNIPAVKRYIENQDEHHRKITFKEELLAFLKKHNVDFDERFVVDGTSS